MNKKTRNSAIILLFLPIAIILFMIAWATLIVGSRKQSKNQTTHTAETSQDDQITIIPMIPEECET